MASPRSSSLCRVVFGALLMGPLLSPLVTAEGSGPRIVVSLRDLDPNDPADARVIYERIKVAAEQVCRRSSDRDLALTPERWACVRGTIEQAVASIGSAVLTRLAQGLNAEQDLTLTRESRASQPLAGAARQ